MLWLTSIDATASALPAAWLIATGSRPANLTERSMLRRQVARRILARQLGVPEAEIDITHDARGRPGLAGPKAGGLQLSLATRAGVVAVALAEQPVGVDVERVEDAAEPPLASLHPRERRLLQALPPRQRPLAFAQLWSAKEAYVKALGTGFIIHAPEGFAVAYQAEGRFLVEDPGALVTARGTARLMKNGDQEDLAAAIVVLAQNKMPTSGNRFSADALL